MSTTTYRVEVRRYTATEDDSDAFECATALAAYQQIDRQSAHGPFRAWVNGVEIRGAYHGLSFIDFLAALDHRLHAHPVWDRVVTNPATYAALGTPL